MKNSSDIMEFRGKYFFLSNFYMVNINYDGQVWPSSEHAYQAAKTFNIDEKQSILVSKTPAEAKHLGNVVTCRKDWPSIKRNIMEDILRVKFQIPELRHLLLETCNVKLCEGNSWSDSYWGVDIITGRGHNWLGRILMMIRLELLDEVMDENFN